MSQNELKEQTLRQLEIFSFTCKGPELSKLSVLEEQLEGDDWGGRMRFKR